MEDFENFVALIEKWKASYVWAIQSCVVAKTDKGKVLLCGKIHFLTSIPKKKCEDFRFASEHIYAARQLSPLTPNNVSQLLQSAKSGRIEIFKESYSLTQEDSGLRFYLPLGDTAFPLDLRISGKSQSHLLYNCGIPRKVDWELKVSDTPFDSLDQLLEYCDLPQTNMGNRDTALEITADMPASIGDCSTLKDGFATIEYHASKHLEPQKLKLGLQLPIDAMNIQRSSVRGDSIEWKRDGDFKIGTHRIESKDVPVVQAYLSYDGVPIHQRSIADSNVQFNIRYAAHLSVDPDVELLREVLLKRQKNGAAESFEGATATLLTLLGFSTLSYGIMRGFTDGPDIIAFTASKQVVVLECTTEGLNHKDKLAKLVRRTQLVRDEFTKADYRDIQVQPVMATLSKRDEVKGDMKDAARFRIAVLTNENLEAALKQVIQPNRPEHFFEELRQLIPVIEGASLSDRLGMLS